MNDTIFGKIIRKEIPATIVYENPFSLAFMDINPAAKGHVILIPKEGYRWMEDLPDDDIASIFITAKHLMKTMKKAFSCDLIEVHVVGEEVPHAHIHLIPRMMGDDLHGPRISYEDGEMQGYADKIISAL